MEINGGITLHAQQKQVNLSGRNNKALEERTQKKQETDQGVVLSLSANAIKNKGMSELEKNLNQQIADMQEQKRELQDSELTPKEKQEQLKSINEQIVDLQKQLAQARMDEQEKQAEELKEKTRENSNKNSTEQDPELEMQKLRTAAMTDIAVASDSLKTADKALAHAHALSKKADLGKGPKYKGNLTAGEVNQLYTASSQSLNFAGRVYKKSEAMAEDATESTSRPSSEEITMDEKKAEEERERRLEPGMEERED